MIHAVEALKRPTAQLTDEEKIRVDEIEKEIEALVCERVEFRGIDYARKEASANVMAAVSQRMKAAGYEPYMEFIVEEHPLNKALKRAVGFKLMLAPTDESYRAAERITLS